MPSNVLQPSATAGFIEERDRLLPGLHVSYLGQEAFL